MWYLHCNREEVSPQAGKRSSRALRNPEANPQTEWMSSLLGVFDGLCTPFTGLEKTPPSRKSLRAQKKQSTICRSAAALSFGRHGEKLASATDGQREADK